MDLLLGAEGSFTEELSSGIVIASELSSFYSKTRNPMASSEPKRDRFLPNAKREHKNDKLFRLKHVVYIRKTKIDDLFHYTHKATYYLDVQLSNSKFRTFTIVKYFILTSLYNLFLCLV